MKNKKWYVTACCTVVCILLDLIGRVIADKCHLPIWFDSIGTVLMAYMAGPVCGAIVGVVNNIVFGIFVQAQSVYCLVGAFIGISVGIAAKKRVFETPFKVMSLSMGLAMACTLFSVPLNLIISDGNVGNVWGDQVVRMCSTWRVPHRLSILIGQFYIEFLDKFVCVVIVYLLIRFSRILRKRESVDRNFGQRIKRDILQVLIAALFIGAVAPGQAKAAGTFGENYNEYIQTVYGSDEGLLAGGANDINQTKDGRIWIGTYAGLYSYDGLRFKLYKDVESIKNVNTLFVDEEGRLWVGTNDSGFTIMISDNVLNVMDEDDGLPSNTVKSITCDSNGYYYVGTAAGLSVVSLSGGVEINKNYNDLKNIVCLTSDDEGNVVALTDDGVITWIRNGEVLEQELFADLAGYSACAAFFSDNGDLYLGTTDKQVFIYQVDNNIPKRKRMVQCAALKHINSFYETEEGEIFVCSDTGVGYFDKRGVFADINTNEFISSVTAIVQDYQGDLWFASSRLGLLRLCKSAFAELFPEVGIGNYVTNSAAVWNGLLYCGTDEGLKIIDEEKGQEVDNELTLTLSSVRIRCVKVDSKDTLWISTSGSGIYNCKKKGNDLQIIRYTEEDGLPGNRFRCILEAKDGQIIVSGDQGVAFIKNGKVVDVIAAEDGVDNIKSLCLMEKDGKLYIGSDGGGISVVQNGKVVKKITREDGLSSNIVMKMVYDEESDGFFVVSGNGLCYVSDEGNVKILDKFPYYDVYDVILGKDDVAWVLSSAGIYIGSRSELINNTTAREYDLINARRGLRSSLTANSWNYLNDGILYLSSDRGVIKVNMYGYDLSAKSYRMILDKITADGVNYEISRISPVVLPPETLKIEIGPEILNYSLNDPYVSYCLEGFDTSEKTMLLSEMGTITYSNLMPGEYTFRISVLDSRKENYIETGSYTIIISHEMYENWWFKLYVGVVTGLIVAWITWFITRVRIRRVLIRQELELEYTKKQLKMGRETILSIARAVDAKDSNTSEHSFRVSEYSVAIAKRLGFSEERSENLRQMAMLHDIGKIGIPDAILNKPSKLTDEEYAIMKTHVTRGGEILKDFSLIENVSIGAMYHHERYDGKGYCTGLKGEEIPLEARIIGIADAFDAMTANRVYRKKLELDFVLEELKRCSGTQFDPKLVDIMISLIEDREIDINELYGKSKEEK